MKLVMCTKFQVSRMNCVESRGGSDWHLPPSRLRVTSFSRRLLGLRNCKKQPLVIKWPSPPVRALGVYFSYDEKKCEKNLFKTTPFASKAYLLALLFARASFLLLSILNILNTNTVFLLRFMALHSQVTNFQSQKLIIIIVYSDFPSCSLALHPYTLKLL